MAKKRKPKTRRVKRNARPLQIKGNRKAPLRKLKPSDFSQEGDG